MRKVVGTSPDKMALWYINSQTKVTEFFFFFFYFWCYILLFGNIFSCWAHVFIYSTYHVCLFCCCWCISVKVLEKKHIMREKKTQYVMREKEVLASVSNHPFFIRLYCTFQDTDRLCILFAERKRVPAAAVIYAAIVCLPLV